MKKWLFILASTLLSTVVLYSLPRWIKGPWPCVNMSYHLSEDDWPRDASGVRSHDQELRPVLEKQGVDLERDVYLTGQNNIHMLNLVALGREHQKMLRAFPDSAIPDVAIEDNRMNYTVVIGGRIYGLRENLYGFWSEPDLPGSVNELLKHSDAEWSTVLHTGTKVNTNYFRARGQHLPEDFQHSGRQLLGVKYKIVPPTAACYEGRAWPVLLISLFVLHLLILATYRPLGRALRLLR